MKNNYFYALATAMLLAGACKKGEDVTPTPVDPPKISETYYRDSIYFKLNGVTYSSNDIRGVGIGNAQPNQKAYSSKIAGRQSAAERGGKYWYGAKDSTYYELFYQSSFKDASAEVHLVKNFSNAQLTKVGAFYIYPNNSEFFKAGSRNMVLDYDTEKSTEGFLLTGRFPISNVYTELTSSQPGAVLTNVPDVGKDFQKDSKFEIEKVTELKDGIILVQAKFNLNVFDYKGNKFVVTDGFLRKKFKKYITNSWSIADID